MQRPLNRFITINWQVYGVSEELGSRYTTKYLKKISHWLKSNGTPTAYIYVRENSKIKGNHVHILIHVTPETLKKLTKLNRKWLKTITGQPYKKGAVKSETVGPSLECVRWCIELYDDNLKRLLDYFLKAVDDQVAYALHIRRHQPSLPMQYKICGYSQGIGPKQRPKNLELSESFLSDVKPLNHIDAEKFIRPVKQLQSATGIT